MPEPFSAALSSGAVPALCHVCDGTDIHVIPEYEALCRVTSDCKPWPRGGRLQVCGICGAMQKCLDDRWAAESEEIYRNYTIYYQADGAEQAVFREGSGEPVLRSERLVERLLAGVAIPEKGRLLDVGCGNGAFLRAFGRASPGWTLAGLEVNDKYAPSVQAMPGVERLYTGTVDTVPGRFSIISLIHALEHIPSPRRVLELIRSKLIDGGLLVVEVPNCEVNPFDLLVADHASHFTRHTLQTLVENSGFDPRTVTSEWLPKELTLVASAASASRARSWSANRGAAPAADSVGWLQAVRAAAQDARAATPAVERFGIFGTSIAGTWLFAELQGGVGFFVDEDPNRVGRRFGERPICDPMTVPAGARVFVGLGAGLADRVAGRMQAIRPDVTWLLPPLSTQVGVGAGKQL